MVTAWPVVNSNCNMLLSRIRSSRPLLLAVRLASVILYNTACLLIIGCLLIPCWPGVGRICGKQD